MHHLHINSLEVYDQAGAKLKLAYTGGASEYVKQGSRGRTPDLAIDDAPVVVGGIVALGKMPNVNSFNHSDCRVALGALEMACSCVEAGGVVGIAAVGTAYQSRALQYDRAGDEHYNTISALHKSMRSSDADAAIYWLARMLQAGDEPVYIARRVVRFAAEDVGLADPQALVVCMAAMDATSRIGMPECGVILAQVVAYCARVRKSVAVLWRSVDFRPGSPSQPVRMMSHASRGGAKHPVMGTDVVRARSPLGMCCPLVADPSELFRFTGPGTLQ